MLSINNLFESKIDKIPLTSEEYKQVKEKFGDDASGCSFAKNKENNKYFCYTHRARSNFYDSINDIPKDKVKFISSTG